MTRVEYMKELELLLSDIPAEEREDAINYYNDYFDAGGEENEEATILGLGSPEELARSIKNAGSVDGEFSERGYSNINENSDYQIDKYTAVEKGESISDKSDNKKVKKQKSTGTIILIVILCIFAMPVLLPLSLTALCLVFGLGIVAIAIVIALAGAVVICGISALIGGFVCLISGIGSLISNPFGALVVMGFGFLGLALGILFILACVKLFSKVIPPIIRGIVSICRKPIDWIINKRKSKMEE